MVFIFVALKLLFDPNSNSFEAVYETICNELTT